MIFISHSTANDGFVDQLAEDLHIRGIQTWVDHRDMPAGSRWVAQLETACLFLCRIRMAYLFQYGSQNHSLDC
jgi:hypothetical protein